jgi:hypothetical protein
MPNVEFTLETVLRDLNDLDAEIRLELYGDGNTGIVEIMRQNGYSERFLSVLMEKTKARLSNLLRVEDRRRIGEQIIEVGEQIREAVSELAQMTALMERIGSLIATIKLRSAVPKAPRQLFAKVLGWLATITNWIKRVSGQLLCGLMTPKEWKLGGTIGTGPFGLADVTVEITFGP